MVSKSLQDSFGVGKSKDKEIMKKNMKVKIWRASAESKSPPEASATAQNFYKLHKLPHLAFCNFSALSSFQTSTSRFTSLHPHTTLLRSLSAACWLVLMILIPHFQQTFPSCTSLNSLWLCRYTPSLLRVFVFQNNHPRWQQLLSWNLSFPSSREG